MLLARSTTTRNGVALFCSRRLCATPGDVLARACSRRTAILVLMIMFAPVFSLITPIYGYNRMFSSWYVLLSFAGATRLYMTHYNGLRFAVTRC